MCIVKNKLTKSEMPVSLNPPPPKPPNQTKPKIQESEQGKYSKDRGIINMERVCSPVCYLSNSLDSDLVWIFTFLISLSLHAA